mmetsp:Transcript_71344/g.104535  ORF Transcript_71344/g.104535 Transcript_71344/m.104535 type:complete len:91 (-) Transcript_71344:516-788(-)
MSRAFEVGGNINVSLLRRFLYFSGLALINRSLSALRGVCRMPPISRTLDGRIGEQPGVTMALLSDPSACNEEVEAVAPWGVAPSECSKGC